jgi:CRP-like cAMP-binding protein
MKTFTFFFEIIEDNNCPLYNLGECFRLTDKSFSAPENKEVCLILVREMTELLFVLMGEDEKVDLQENRKIYSCSGCSGLIKFRLGRDLSALKTAKQERSLNAKMQTLLSQVLGCSLFRAVPPRYLTDILDNFSQEVVREGSTLIRKGEPNLKLYIVLAGGLSVDDGPVNVSTLGPNDICGEMSYLSGNIASTTVSAISETILISLDGEYFKKIIDQSPTVQLFMAQLLAARLDQANRARAREFDSCMQGRLKDMAPAELFQILNMHQKTGVLSLTFSGREAQVSFREGCIINAIYGNLENQEAIFEILGEKEGVYSFTIGLSPQQMKAAEIGDFMMLLMEGVKRVDEEYENL